MNILCDTCSVLMLIRIAPYMFLDERFKCITVQDVRKEIFQTQKFKTKYPWRNNFKDKIQASRLIVDRGDEFNSCFKTIRQIIDAGIINNKAERTFSLSFIDQKIAAYTIAYNLEISSTDNDLIDFLEQEFEKINKSPLAILNEWIKIGLVTWNNELQRIIEDWDRNGEPVQPSIDKKEFEKLTGCKYLSQ